MTLHTLPPARHQARHVGGSEALAFTVGSNVSDADIVGLCRYQRVDDVVTVSGSVTIDLTTTGASVFNIALPTLAPLVVVAAAGSISGMYLDADGDVGVIVGDTGSDDAEVTFSATANTARIAQFWFSYVADAL